MRLTDCLLVRDSPTASRFGRDMALFGEAE